MTDPFPGNLKPNIPDSPKRMLLAATGVIGILLLPFLALTLLWHDRCPTTAVHAVTSPGGTFVAEQVIRDCGHAMPKASEIHLFKLLAGQRDAEKTVLVLPSTDNLTITWNAEDNVAINLPNNQSQVVTYKREWQGVHIALIGDIISSLPKTLSDQM